MDLLKADTLRPLMSILIIICYLSAVIKKIFLRIINKLTKHKFQKAYLKHKFKANDICMLLNYIECEAHSELFVEGLKRFIN